MLCVVAASCAVLACCWLALMAKSARWRREQLRQFCKRLSLVVVFGLAAMLTAAFWETWGKWMLCVVAASCDVLACCWLAFMFIVINRIGGMAFGTVRGVYGNRGLGGT